MESNNDTYVIYSLEPQAYKVVTPMLMKSRDRQLYTDLSMRNAHAPRLIGMNGGDNYDLATLAFNNIKQLDDFHSIILIIQQ